MKITGLKSNEETMKLYFYFDDIQAKNKINK